MPMTQATRANLAALSDLPPRNVFPLALELADASDASSRKVRGVANTFNVMRSGRILAMSGAVDFLKRNPTATLPLLAQHGMVPEFSTIGRIDRMAVDPKRGLTFEATVAQSTPLADNAWQLIRQGMLGQISVGWSPLQARMVSVQDRDIDPDIKARLEADDVESALAFLRYDVLEISLVDVADDPGAKLNAGRTRLEKLEERRTDSVGDDLAERMMRTERRAALLDDLIETISACDGYQSRNDAIEAYRGQVETLLDEKGEEIDAWTAELASLTEDPAKALTALRKRPLAERVALLADGILQAERWLLAIAIDPESEYAKALDRAAELEAAGHTVNCGHDGCSAHFANDRERDISSLTIILRGLPDVEFKAACDAVRRRGRGEGDTLAASIGELIGS